MNVLLDPWINTKQASKICAAQAAVLNNHINVSPYRGRHDQLFTHTFMVSEQKLLTLLLNCLRVFFIHLKLELLTEFPASKE